MSKYDKIDRKIVGLLREDGRMSASEIARRVDGGITERVVRYRINRMLAENVIQICPVVNPQAFGFTTRADVFLEVDSDAIMKVARTLAEYEQVSYTACSIGEKDVSIQVFGKDTEEVYRFVTEVVGRMPGVRKTSTSIVPIVLKDVYQWKVPREFGTE
jgi:Lrp/AsnC family transcriptional regulator for asnA, asnC and gidA